MITKKQTKKYVAEGGIKCPVCGFEEIEGGSIEVDSGGAYQEMSCPNCYEEWQDVYRLVDVFQNGD